MRELNKSVNKWDVVTVFIITVTIIRGLLLNHTHMCPEGYIKPCLSNKYYQ